MTLIDVTASYQRRYYPLVGHRDVQLDIEVTEVTRKTRRVRLRIINPHSKTVLAGWSMSFNSGASTSAMFGSLAKLNSATVRKNDGTKALSKRKDDPDLARMIESAASGAKDKTIDDKSSYTWDDVRDYIVAVIPGRAEYLRNSVAELKAEKAEIDKKLKAAEAALKQ